MRKGHIPSTRRHGIGCPNTESTAYSVGLDTASAQGLPGSACPWLNDSRVDILPRHYLRLPQEPGRIIWTYTPGNTLLGLGIDKRGGSWYKIVWPGAPVFCPRQEGDFVATPPAFLVVFWYARENGSNEPFWRHSAADEASRELVTRYSSVECPPWTAAHTRWVTASRFCGVFLCHAGRLTPVMLCCPH